MYDPQVGRFLTEDPVGFSAQDANLYRYADNDPLRSVDPSGTVKLQLAGRGLQIIATAEQTAIYMGWRILPERKDVGLFEDAERVDLVWHQKIDYKIQRCDKPRFSTVSSWQGKRDDWFHKSVKPHYQVGKDLLMGEGEDELRQSHLAPSSAKETSRRTPQEVRKAYKEDKCFGTRGKVLWTFDARILTEIDIGPIEYVDKARYGGEGEPPITEVMGGIFTSMRQHHPFAPDPPKGWKQGAYWSTGMRLEIEWNSCLPGPAKIEVRGSVPKDWTAQGEVRLKYSTTKPRIWAPVDGRMVEVTRAGKS